MKVYVASSWRNVKQPAVVAALRAAGHEVYDFRNPAPGNDGFAWSEIDPAWESWTEEQYVAALRHPLAVQGFASDMNALLDREACVLVEPCGISAHLEFGWAIGAGRLGLVDIEGIREPELMLAMALDGICFSTAEVVRRLSGYRPS